MASLEWSRGNRFFCHFSTAGKAYVRCFENVMYMRHYCNILRRLGGSFFLDWPTDSVESILFLRPYDHIYIFTNWRFLSLAFDFKWHIHANEQVIPACWRHEELFAVLLMGWIRWYASSPSRGECIECGRSLTVPASPVLVHYSKLGSMFVLKLMIYGMLLPSNLLQWL